MWKLNKVLLILTLWCKIYSLPAVPCISIENNDHLLELFELISEDGKTITKDKLKRFLEEHHIINHENESRVHSHHILLNESNATKISNLHANISVKLKNDTLSKKLIGETEINDTLHYSNDKDEDNSAIGNHHFFQELLMPFSKVNKSYSGVNNNISSFTFPSNTEQNFNKCTFDWIISGVNTSNENVLQDDLLHISPGIVLSFLSNCSNKVDGRNTVYCEHNGHGHSHHKECSTWEYRNKDMWIGGLLSMCIIGLTCVSCIFIIPCLKRGKYYEQIHQFLVALAVGTLSGDSLIHLIPHAISMDTSPLSHMMHALYGFTAFLGMAIFLFLERSHNLFVHSHSENHSSESPIKDDEKELSHVQSHIKQESSEVDRVSSHKSINKTKESQHCFDGCPPNLNLGGDTNRSDTAEVKKRTIDATYASAAEKEKLVGSYIGQTQNKIAKLQPTLPPVVISEVHPGSSTFSYTQQEYYMGHHGHSHHGHSHISGHKDSLCIMILLGDAIHTFMDGIAIGAAFGSSLTAGLATALAVLSHELPHKVGDFALLFEMGMNQRKAFKVMVILWGLSMIGVIVGILVGSIKNASPWIYSFTAGIFLYLALVDLLSELSISGGNTCISVGQMAVQFTGMLVGAVLMLVIASYEHNLEELFEHSF